MSKKMTLQQYWQSPELIKALPIKVQAEHEYPSVIFTRLGEAPFSIRKKSLSILLEEIYERSASAARRTAQSSFYELERS